MKQIKIIKKSVGEIFTLFVKESRPHLEKSDIPDVSEIRLF